MARPADEVYQDLKSAIQTGTLAPGEHLVEDALRHKYGISRTPVRNALRKLSDEGLVTVEPNRGAFVATWTSDDATEVMTIRVMLEPYAAELAAQRRTAEQLAQMYELCDAMEKAERTRDHDFRDDLARDNHALHQLILESSASPRLYNIALTLTRAPLMIGSFQFYDDAQLRRSLEDHRLVVEAIEARDGATARAVMDVHLRLAHRTMATLRSRNTT